MANIGFIGLGHMGLPMATHLMKAGHHVLGFDLQAAALEALSAAGGNVAPTVQDVALSADVVITMLQTGNQVKQVALGDSGCFAVMQPQSLFIDCSTIDVATARELHEAAMAQDILSVDAPVSGGVAGANAATLTFMVGGENDAFLTSKPLLALMGRKIIHAGIAGNGQAAKICNNMILGSTMIAVSEAFILAKSMGLTPQQLHDVVINASGRCWVMDTYVPVAGVLENVPANRGYQPGFTVAMMLKDLCLSQQVAKASNVALPMAQEAATLYQQFHDMGHSGLDFSAIIEFLEKMYNQTID